jgi:pimeloyl-ACP methyl ester carboxylesterase
MTPRVPIKIAVGPSICLRGEACQGGELWAVLVHDQGEDLDRWQDVPEQLAGFGVSVLAIDLRGHGGSDGEPGTASVLDDLDAATGAARLRGAVAVVVVAAGASATIALDRSSADAVVAITPQRGGAEPSPERPLARLLIASRDHAVSSASAAYQAERGRRTLIARIPVDDTGLDLLSGDWGSNVASYIVTFVRRIGLELQPGRYVPDRSTAGGGASWQTWM